MALPYKQELDALYAPDHMPPANIAFWKNLIRQDQVENNPSPGDTGFRDFRRNPPNVGDIIFVKNSQQHGCMFKLYVGQVDDTRMAANGLFGTLMSLNTIDPTYSIYPVIEFLGSTVDNSVPGIAHTYVGTVLKGGTSWMPVEEALHLIGGKHRYKKHKKTKVSKRYKRKRSLKRF